MFKVETEVEEDPSEGIMGFKLVWGEVPSLLVCRF